MFIRTLILTIAMAMTGAIGSATANQIDPSVVIQDLDQWQQQTCTDTKKCGIR